VILVDTRFDTRYSEGVNMTASAKPNKPYDDFPLFPHATRRWAKKIRGKMHYFGPWEDWRGALKKYQEQKDDLHAGRTPRVQGDGVTVRDLLNRYLTSKKMLADSGEILARTFGDYKVTCDRVGETFGLTRLVDDLRPEDFELLRSRLAKTFGPSFLAVEIQRTRSVFEYAFDSGLIDRPVRYGPTFKRPSKAVLRKLRAAKGPRMFEADELRKMVEAAGPQLKAMILLGANCGFGNNDCGSLPLSALDLENGWVRFPRPKTGVERRCPLWPETVAAIRAAIAVRPAPKDEKDAGLAFLTSAGMRWARETKICPLTKEMAALLQRLGLYKGNGLNFYGLRHTFETIGGESRDQAAVDHIMGHSRNDMATHYRERISDERLKAVTDFIHAWLFPPGLEKTTRKGRGKKDAAATVLDKRKTQRV
jgi:integrase